MHTAIILFIVLVRASTLHSFQMMALKWKKTNGRRGEFHLAKNEKEILHSDNDKNFSVVIASHFALAFPTMNHAKCDVHDPIALQLWLP